MKNKTRYLLNNQFFENPKNFGSIKLLQLGRRFCEPEEVISPHAHLEWYELTIITSGNGLIGANGELYPVKAGDVYLSFPYDLHEIRADKESKLEYDFISFYCIDEDIKKQLTTIAETHFLSSSRVVREEKIADLVQMALTEFSRENQPFKERVLKNILDHLLISTVRSFMKIGTKPINVSDAEIICFKVMNYIDTHIYSLNNLNVIAEELNYNYGYLSGLFKKTTGKNISEYHINRKMETAKALILENKKKIKEIAESLNYTLYSFSKAFKAKYGVSPKNIRKNK